MESTMPQAETPDTTPARAPRVKRSQKAPKKKVAPLPPAPAAPDRTMELIGLTEDGRMVLWQTGNVQPISALPRDGIWIKSGHYVIDWNGNAITVHLGNYADGRVSLQFMCGAPKAVPIAREDIEPLLLGMVIPDTELEAQIDAMFKDIFALLEHRDREPRRQRGRA